MQPSGSNQTLRTLGMRQSVTAHQRMKPPSQIGNGENYPSFDSPDRGVMPARLIPGVGQGAVPRIYLIEPIEPREGSRKA
jgi:hypothetical protein